ncbi:hypothetical protein Q5752_001784 [Cryptotrichosporon argae]
MRLHGLVALGALALAPLARAGQLAIKNAKLSLTSPGADDQSYALDTPLTAPIELAEHGALKLSFAVYDAATSAAVAPRQASVLFEDPTGAAADVVLPVSVKTTGKASFTLNLAKAPAPILASPGEFTLTLLLSSPTTKPLAYPIGTLRLPAAALLPVLRTRHALPPRAGEPAFAPEPEIVHMFRADEKSVPAPVSAVGTAAVLAPWAVLAYLYARLRPSLQPSAAPTTAYVFVAALAGLEALIAAYWLGGRLYTFLPPFLALGTATAYVGTVASRALRDRREKRV